MLQAQAGMQAGAGLGEGEYSQGAAKCSGEEEGKPGGGHGAGGYSLQAERREVVHGPLSSLRQGTMVLTSLGSRIWVQAMLRQVHT